MKSRAQAVDAALAGCDYVSEMAADNLRDYARAVDATETSLHRAVDELKSHMHRETVTYGYASRAATIERFQHELTVQEDVPTSTLRRHLVAKEAPHPAWMAYYWHGLTLPFYGWYPPAYMRRVEKQAKALAEAHAHEEAARVAGGDR